MKGGREAIKEGGRTEGIVFELNLKKINYIFMEVVLGGRLFEVD